MKQFSSQESFKMYDGSKVYMIITDLEVMVGEKVIIDGEEIVVKKSERKSGCICGNCGKKNRIYIQI